MDENTAQPQTDQPQATSQESSISMEKVLDILKVNPESMQDRDIKQIGKIVTWAKNEVKSGGEFDVLQRIKEIKDFVAPLGNTAHHKTIYRYLYLGGKIEDGETPQKPVEDGAKLDNQEEN